MIMLSCFTWRRRPKINFLKHRIEFTRKNCISRGIHSEVYRGTYQQKDVAIKCIRDTNKEARHEIEIHRECCLRAVGAVQIYLDFCEKQQTFLITELCEQDLFNFLVDSDQKISTAEFWELASWLRATFDCCHKSGIAHLDIKLENIGLLKVEDGIRAENLRVLDFGSAKRWCEAGERICYITPSYMPPEIRAGKIPQSPAELRAIDYFMCGALLYCAWHKSKLGTGRRAMSLEQTALVEQLMRTDPLKRKW